MSAINELLDGREAWYVLALQRGELSDLAVQGNTDSLKKKTQERVGPASQQLASDVGMGVEGLVSEEENPHLAGHVLDDS